MVGDETAGQDLLRYLPSGWEAGVSLPLPPAAAAQVRDHLATLLHTVATYLPRCVVEPILLAPPREPVHGLFRWGTVLFADVSGFTALSEQMRRSRLGREGAEAITDVVNRYFGVMTGIAQRHGGDLLKFGGDAILLLFEGEGHAWRGCLAAAEMQTAMSTDLSEAGIAETPISLRLAIGLGTGPLFTASLGTAESLEFAVLGPALERMGRAESMAAGGQIVLDEATLQAAGRLPVTPADQAGYFRLETAKLAHDFCLDPASAPDIPLPPGDAHTQIAWLVARLDALTPYLPPGLLRRLQADPAQPRALDETRWVTVLFADIPGVNALVESLRDRPPDELTALLNGYFTAMRDCVECYEGVVNKLGVSPVGLHIMALFGAPLAHEDDPERAVLAALNMRAALEQAGFRVGEGAASGHGIGVNTGFVFAGNVGMAGRREYTVMGDEVNLAFRLMTAASPGEVLISRTTAHYVEERVQLMACPPIHVKGKADPVAHYRALALQTGLEAGLGRRWEGPLVDREEAMARIRQALDAVGNGEGRVVVVRGEAGIGKSRLVGEGMELARQRGFLILAATSLSYGRDTPYLPWAELLRALLEIREGEPPDEQIRRVRAGLERLGAEEWAPVLGEVLGLPVEDTPLTAALTPHLRQQRLFDLTLALIRHRATPSGLMLAMEDIQWADPASLDLLDYLARNLRDMPLALFIVHRPDERLEGRWQQLKHCVDVLLEELPPPAVQEMVAHLLQGLEVPESLYQMVCEKAQGNPLFVEEIVRSLKESGALRWDDGHWLMDTRLSATQIPDTVHGLLQSRIDRLVETDRRVLQVAACIGQTFPVQTLAGVYPYGDLGSSLPQRLERLTALELTAVEPSASIPTYAFRHTLIREVAYESLAYGRRRELHRHIGELIERERAETLPQWYNLLAYHFYQGQVWDKAADYGLKAGELARREYANEVALAQFQRVLEAVEEGRQTSLELTEVRLQAHEALGDVMAVIGEYDQALEHYEAARKLVEDSPPGEERSRHLADLCRRTAEVYERKSEYDTALRWLQQGLEELGQWEPLEAARIYRLGAGIYHRLGQNDQAIAWCRRSMEIARASQDPQREHTLAHLYFLMAEIYRRYGDLNEAVKYAHQSLEAYRSLEDLLGASQAYNTLGNVYFEVGDWSKAARFYRLGMEIKERVGDVYGQAVIANNLGEVLLYQGDLEAAQQVYERSMGIWERLGVTFGIAVLHNNLAVVHIRSQEWEDAQEHLRRSLELFREIGVEDWLPEVYRHLAEVAVGQGRLDDALAYAAAALDLARQHKMQLEEGIAARIVGLVYHRLGQDEWALRELQSSLEMLEGLDSPYEVARTHLALARLYADRREKDAAQTHRSQAIETFRHLGARLDLEEALMLEVQDGG